MSLFHKNPPPLKPVSEIALTEAPPPRERRILLVGSEFDWLHGNTTLANRKVTRANTMGDALALLDRESFDGLVGGFPTLEANIALLDAASAAHAGLACGLSAAPAPNARLSFSYPQIPPTRAVEALDDHVRTMLATAQWNADPAFMMLKAHITRVPALPSLYTQITQALRSESTNVGDLADLITKEPTVSAKLLMVVNSAAFALRQRVTSIRDAATFVGFQRIRALVLSTSLFNQCDASRCRSFDAADFESHGLKIAKWASQIAVGETRDWSVGEQAFTAGLLHQFGILLLAANVPESYDLVLRLAIDQEVSIATMERQTYGVTSSELAGYFLAGWHIPFPIVNAVGNSCAPSRSEDDVFTPLTAVHLAVGIDTFATTGADEFDREYLDRLKLLPRLDHWTHTLLLQELAVA